MWHTSSQEAQAQELLRRSLLAVSFKCVPCFSLKVSMSLYSVDERHDSVTRDSCPQ